MTADSTVLLDEEDEKINLQTVQITKNNNWEEEVARGRLSSVGVEEFSRDDDSTEMEIQGFSKAVGSITIHRAGALALDFLLLFMSNGILQNIMRETNQYASQTVQSKNKDPATWREVSMEELKTLFSLLIAMSIQKLPCLKDYWSSDWVFSVSGFSKVIPRNRFLDIKNNIHLRDNTKMPRPGDINFDKFFKVRKFIDDLKTNFQINSAPTMRKL